MFAEQREVVVLRRGAGQAELDQTGAVLPDGDDRPCREEDDVGQRLRIEEQRDGPGDEEVVHTVAETRGAGDSGLAFGRRS